MTNLDKPNPDLPPKVTTWHPEELGWQKVGNYTWEDTKGMRHEFSKWGIPRVSRLENNRFKIWSYTGK